MPVWAIQLLAAIGVVGATAGGWWLYDRSQAEISRLEVELAESRTQEELLEAFQAAGLAASREREEALASLRRQLSEVQNAIRQIPENECYDAPLPDAALRLLRGDRPAQADAAASGGDDVRE